MNSVRTKFETSGGLALLLAATTLLSGCGDPLEYAQDIDGPRALGVRVQAEGGTATPDVGESADLSFLFAGTEGPLTVEVAYEVCPAVETARGVPPCASSPWVEGMVTVADDAPAISFTVPEGTEPSTRVALRAVACETGTPELAEDPLDWSCSDDSFPIKVMFDLWTAGDVVNENPDLSAGAMFLEGQALAPAAIGDPPACIDGDPEFGVEEELTMRVGFGADVRQALDDGTEESLQISHFSTRGFLERQFTILDPEEDTETTLLWETPESAGPVKHYVVVRDGRGGVSWMTVNACVTE